MLNIGGKGVIKKVKKITISTLICLVIAGGTITGFLNPTANAETQTFTGHPYDLDTITTRTINSNYIQKLRAELKKEGYNNIKSIVLEQDRKKSEVIIHISADEYKGEQTKNTMEKAVNRLAKENKIGSFLVYIKNSY